MNHLSKKTDSDFWVKFCEKQKTDWEAELDSIILTQNSMSLYLEIGM